MVLPNSQHTRVFRVVMPKPRRRIINAAEYGVPRLSNSNKTILILQRSIVALLVLLEPVERHHPGAKAEAHQLMPATDRQHWNSTWTNKLGEGVENRGIVVIKIA